MADEYSSRARRPGQRQRAGSYYATSLMDRFAKDANSRATRCSRSGPGQRKRTRSAGARNTLAHQHVRRGCGNADRASARMGRPRARAGPSLRHRPTSRAAPATDVNIPHRRAPLVCLILIGWLTTRIKRQRLKPDSVEALTIWVKPYPDTNRRCQRSDSSVQKKRRDRLAAFYIWSFVLSSINLLSTGSARRFSFTSIRTHS